MKLFYKYFLSFLTISISAALAIALLFYFQFKAALIERTLLQLASVNFLKKEYIENHLFETKKSVEFSFLNKKGMYLTATNIATQFPEFNVKSNLKADSVLLETVSVTLVQQKEMTLFSCRAVINDSVIVDIPVAIKPIQKILLERVGLGKTGESYLVGEDYKMLTESRFIEEGSVKGIEVKTQSVFNAFEGETESLIVKDYRGIEVLSASRLLEIDGVHIAILSEIDFEEALGPIRLMRSKLIIIFSILCIATVVMSFALSKQLISKVLVLKESILALSQGILPPKPKRNTVKDEVDQITEAVFELIVTFEEMMVFAGKVGSGDFLAGYALRSDKDILGKSLLQMRNQLQSLKSETDKLERYSKESIVEGQEIERARLSKDIHDGVGPLLTSIKLQLNHIEGNEDQVQVLKTRLDEVITEVRKISYNLMPSALLDFGVGEAIGNLLKTLGEEPEVHFINDIQHPEVIPEKIHVALYRIAQETLNNALKYADATGIKLSLTLFDDKVCFYIADNGKGFDVAAYNNTESIAKGLRNVKERVRILGGEVYIHSDMEGTQIEVEIPLENG